MPEKDEITRELGTQPSRTARNNDLPPGKRYLLTIAIDQYGKAGFNALKYPVSDAKALKGVLNNDYGFNEIISIEDDQCDKDNIVRQINLLSEKLSLQKTSQSDQLVVFFAGHGATGTNNKCYWMPYDCKEEIFQNLAVSAVLDDLVGCCSQILLIVDCCFGGDAAEKAYYASITSKNHDSSSISVICSGNNSQTVPDKSIFMQTLLEILRNNSVTSFEDLVSDMTSALRAKRSTTTITPFSPPLQKARTFLLQREDVVSYHLTNSLFELNFSKQIPALKGIRMFNMTYLRGQRESGHQLLTQRYFKLMDNNSVTMFNYNPYVTKYGKETDGADYCLWKRIAKEMNIQHPEPGSVTRFLLDEVQEKNILIIVKIDSCCQTTLNSELSKFWNELTTEIGNAAPEKNYTNSVYIFLWDRREDLEEADIIAYTDVRQKTTEWAKLLILPPIEELDPHDDIAEWHSDTLWKNAVLREAKSFKDIRVTDIEKPHTMQNVIIQITDLCDKPTVYKTLFNNQNRWAQ